VSYQLPSRKLVSQDDHAMIQRADVARTKFQGSWTHKTTFDAGYLVPFLVDEVLPGDHNKYDVMAYLRMATPLFPIFDNQRIDTFFFFVPNRIIWTNWVKMMGEQDNPGDSINFSVPIIDMPNGGYAVGSIFDYMGLPTIGQITAGQSIDSNALPLRAYNTIYNAWFRDENLINRAYVNTGDGTTSSSNYILLKRAKSHDYFTSALPWPQKFTAPTVPLGGQAPIVGLGYDGNTLLAGAFQDINTNAAVAYPLYNQNPIFANIGSVYADLSAATGVAINTFRQAFLVQTLLERDARGGTRYVELLKSHFNVTSPDFRLQRPEYIGGGSTPLVVTPIAQTATGGGGLGALGGAGTAAGSHRASYAATEHGFIIGLINVRTELSYQQGLHKMWSRRTRYDYFWPSLGGLGEQAILRKEIYVTGVDADDETVFGYQERWHEYRQQYSYVTGLFKSTSAGNIDEWHLAQQFSSAPTLGQTFVEDTPPMTRVLAAGSAANGMQYLADLLINREKVTAVPMFGTPVTLGRF